jgi:tetratricopeptide (TPR) repeat protein
VDLRRGITPEGIERLVWGITGEKPLPGAGPLPPGPRRHNLPFRSLGNLLKGRDEDLRTLAASLEGPSHATAITQPQVVHGLGGIGKTRLAVEYAWRSGDRYDAALFVVADSRASLRTGLARLARLLLPDQPAGRAEDELVEAVLACLQDQNRWLLILDNVDTEEAEGAVLEILPRLSNGHVLVTSRRADWPAGVDERSLDKLPPEEAARFLLERTGKKRAKAADDAERASDLAKILDGLPLALEQAAAYISHRRISLSDYVRDWERERDAVLSWFDPTVMQYPASMAVTWQKTADELGPTPRALLRLCAFLAPDPIPVEMFEEGKDFVDEAVSLLCEETGEEPRVQAVVEALGDLADYSMIFHEGRTFRVHRMVQEVLRSRVPEGRRRDWIEKVLRMVNWFSPFDADDVRTWPVWDLLRPHAGVLVGWAEEIDLRHPTNRLMSQLALLLYAKSLHAEAEPLMRRALAIDEASFGNKHPRVAAQLNNLAQLLQTTNRLAEAEPLVRRALAIDEASFGNEHPNVARNLNNLAGLLKATNRLAEAEPLMRRALAIDEASFGNEHPEVATDLNNLAQLLQDTNRLVEAEPLMRRALAIDEASFGNEHPDVAIDLNNLAGLLQATSRLAEAEPLMRRALAIDEASFGNEHPQVAAQLNNLAQLLQATNRLAEAEPLMRRALAIDEASFGNEHPNVARDLNNLARLLQDTNRLAEAEPLMRRALAIDEASFGKEHPNVAIRLNNLAQLLQDTNRLAEAEPLMRRAVEIWERSLVPDHPWTQTGRRNLEILLREIADGQDGPEPG